MLARQCDRCGKFYTLENTAEETQDRDLCPSCVINAERISKMKIDPDSYQRVVSHAVIAKDRCDEKTIKKELAKALGDALLDYAQVGWKALEQEDFVRIGAIIDVLTHDRRSKQEKVEDLFEKIHQD